MSLRTRLLLGYGYLVLLILLTAGGAAVGVFQLSKGISDVVENNFFSINATSRMLGSLGRQDNATLRALLDAEHRRLSLQNLAEADAAFDAAYEKAAGNATIAGESRLIDEIESAYLEYREARDALIAARPAEPVEAYNLRVYEQSRQVRSRIFELLDLNQQAIAAADKRARRIAARNGVWLGVVVTLALISLIGLSRALRRHFLSRLAEFEEVSEALAEGEVQRRFKPGADDELGALARRFNSVLDAQEQLQVAARGRLNQQRQLLVGALAQRDEGVGLLGLDGMLIASTLEGDAELGLQAHRGWVREGGRELVQNYKTGARPPTHVLEYKPDCALIFELLVAQRRRPVGWMVRMTSNNPAS
jgi:hypothetical protein